MIMLFVFCAGESLAGPPFITDDPEPVDYHHWEIYLFFSGARAGNETSGTGPAHEVNYGALPNVQLAITVPIAYDKGGGRGFQDGMAIPNLV